MSFIEVSLYFAGSDVTEHRAERRDARALTAPQEQRDERLDQTRGKNDSELQIGL
jgi:hypothetical protein